MDQYDANNGVFYMKHEVNYNGVAARNTGIKYSYGYYIAFLDNDGWSLSKIMGLQIYYLHKHSEYAACYCLAQRDGKPIKGEAES